ncbi:MAG: hypothetical protein HGA49_03180 [Eubacteriaceae bacterium]|nr:hypothetical protein [Eubacteriaceae bacterium]
MKRYFILLCFVFIAVMLLGMVSAKKSLYTEAQINKYNQENKVDIIANKNTDSVAPQIIVVYPDNLDNGQTVAADKVYLKFLDNIEVAQAFLNDQQISLDSVVVTSLGISKILIVDSAGNKAEFSFTIVPR